MPDDEIIMMNQAVVIESVTTSQENLLAELKALGVPQILVFQKPEDVFSALDQIHDEVIVVYVDMTDGLLARQNFLQDLRSRFSKAVVIPLITNVTYGEMKVLMHMEMDQILRLPFTMDQLKQRTVNAVQYRRKSLNSDLQTIANSQFDIVFEELTEQFYRATLSGWLTEAYTLPSAKPPLGDATLFIDCGDLRVINSIGIKHWLMWIKSLTNSGFTHFEFEKLRPGFLQLASFVSGFIPANGTVNSFYLHYWSDELDLKRDFKFVEGQDYTSEKLVIPKTQTVVEDGQSVVYELDDAASLILRFFKGTVEFKEDAT